MEAELLNDFGNAHDSHILLVGKNQEDCVLEVVFGEHLVEFLPGDLNSFFVRRVDDIDEGLGVLVVVFPELSDLILTSDVLDGEFDLLELNSFDIEADGGN